MGHDAIKTPHLDKLAERSLIFERGYVASPLCRPSLASMLTGRFPSDHGVAGNDVDARNNRAVLDAPVKTSFHKLPSFRETPHRERLPCPPIRQVVGGFVQRRRIHPRHETLAAPEGDARHGDVGLTIGCEGMKPITDFLDYATAEKKPFLLWYAPYLPHTPHNPPKRLLKKYTRPDRNADVAKYYAMCEWFDETCGTLLDELERRGLAENHVVIYICDNGWAATSTNAADPNQTNFKGYALRSKSSPFENGIRTPIMVSWPGNIEPSRPKDLAHAIDLFPTIAAATGLKAPLGLPGINLTDATARKNRDTVFGVTHSVANMTPGDPDATLQYRWCVSGDWKVMLRHEGSDITEYKNYTFGTSSPFDSTI